MFSCVINGVAEDASENRILTRNRTRNWIEWTPPLSHLLLKNQKLSSRKQKKVWCALRHNECARYFTLTIRKRLTLFPRRRSMCADSDAISEACPSVKALRIPRERIYKFIGIVHTDIDFKSFRGFSNGSLFSAANETGFSLSIA